jgi:transposase InsO family protein
MVNAKRVYRLYGLENRKVRSLDRKKIGRRQRVAQGPATGPNQCWSADFVSDKLTDGRSYRILTVIDQFTRECVALEADRSLHGRHVVAALARAGTERGKAPRSITLDTAASSLAVRWKPGRFKTESRYASSAQDAHPGYWRFSGKRRSGSNRPARSSPQSLWSEMK